MSKDQTVIKSFHSFTLTRLKPDCHYHSITADFTPPLNLNQVQNSIVPAFLIDHNFYTPAFIVPRDKEYYGNTSAFEKEKFQARISKAKQLCNEQHMGQENLPQICPPIPTTNYCQICKSGYNSYQEHLKEISHQRQARYSKANTYISQLCKLYSKKTSKAGPKEKNKPIRKAQQQKCTKKHQPSRPKKNARASENPPGVKNQNCSTNVPSLIPTPYC